MVTLLSLFDGIGCAGLAMRELFGNEVNYFASEIDPHLINFTRHKFPDIWHLGDVRHIKLSGSAGVDYLICGSPCQDLSKAGKRKGLSGDHSSLFWEAVRIRDEAKPKYWLFENVVSSKANMEAMTNALGVRPIIINSRYFTYQDRVRAYWTNILPVHPTRLGMQLNEFRTCRIIRVAFNKLRVTPHFPTLTRNIKTCAWAKQLLRDNWDGSGWSKTLPTDWDEYELAQGLPEGYTDSLPNVKRRLAIANAFTVPVISYILRFSLLTGLVN